MGSAHCTDLLNEWGNLCRHTPTGREAGEEALAVPEPGAMEAWGRDSEDGGGCLRGRMADGTVKDAFRK